MEEENEHTRGRPCIQILARDMNDAMRMKREICVPIQYINFASSRYCASLEGVTNHTDKIVHILFTRMREKDVRKLRWKLFGGTFPRRDLCLSTNKDPALACYNRVTSIPIINPWIYTRSHKYRIAKEQTVNVQNSLCAITRYSRPRPWAATSRDSSATIQRNAYECNDL